MDHSEAKRLDRESQDAILRRLRDDFTYYAPRVLRIADKDTGQVVPFVLNREQQYVHQKLEEQRAKTGKVRAIIVKPRQRGISTYIEARFYHRTSTRRGRNAFILSHLDLTTKAIFDMVERYYVHDAVIHPHVDRSNARELRFDRMGSSFRVATAESKNVAHGTTNHLLHGSEVAYWSNPEAHMTGVGQTVPNAEDTEIILESTGNGRGTWFYNVCQDALSNKGEYILIFFPWFWAEDYRLPVPPGFEFSSDDRDYQSLYEITDDQLYWRRMKIEGPDFHGDELLFQQSYPATLAEAFISRDGSFIPGDAIARARKTKVADPVGPLVVGADPTAYGDDRFAISWRRGRKHLKQEAHRHFGPMQCVDRIAKLIQTDRPAKVFVDIVGIGAGVVDRLHQLGYKDIVIGVAGSEKPTEPERHYNKRAEMYDAMRHWITDAPCELVDSDELEADLIAVGYGHDDTGQRLKIEGKERMRSRGVKSPDNADSLALTFAYPVSEVLDEDYAAPMRVKRRRRDWRVNL